MDYQWCDLTQTLFTLDEQNIDDLPHFELNSLERWKCLYQALARQQHQTHIHATKCLKKIKCLPEILYCWTEIKQLGLT